MRTKPPIVHDEAKAKRGSDGRFLPGHLPPRSPGRPPGPNGVKARAAKLAGERLEETLGLAAEVVEKELKGGNPAVAIAALYVMANWRSRSSDTLVNRSSIPA